MSSRFMDLVAKAKRASRGFFIDDDSHVLLADALDELENMAFDLHHGPIPEGPRCPDCDGAVRLVDAVLADFVRECTQCGCTWQDPC